MSIQFPKPANLPGHEASTAIMLRVHAKGRACGENYPEDFASFHDDFQVVYFKDPAPDAAPGTPPQQVTFDRVMVTPRRA